MDVVEKIVVALVVATCAVASTLAAIYLFAEDVESWPLRVCSAVLWVLYGVLAVRGTKWT